MEMTTTDPSLPVCSPSGERDNDAVMTYSPPPVPYGAQPEPFRRLGRPPRNGLRATPGPPQYTRPG